MGNRKKVGMHISALAAVTGLAVAATSVAAQESILVQSTTSTEASGLYDHLLPIFEQEKGITVNVVAVGTGQAIQNARNCDGDVLLVHAKAQEEQFVADGAGVERFDLMYNDFVVVGPASDPAGIDGMTDAQAAFARIARPRRHSPPAATNRAHTPRSSRSGRRPASTWTRRRAVGIARPAPAWALRSTLPSAWRPTR
jgi:ABC-type tungstate transport system permease subunit